MTNKTWHKYSERKPRLDFSRIRVRRGVVVADVGRALREYLFTYYSHLGSHAHETAPAQQASAGYGDHSRQAPVSAGGARASHGYPSWPWLLFFNQP